MKRVVWTSVFAALSSVAAFGSAIAGETDFVLAFGFMSVSMAFLASRES